MGDPTLEGIADALAKHYKIELKPMRPGSIQGRQGKGASYLLYDEVQGDYHVVRFIRSFADGAYESAAVSSNDGRYQFAYKTSGTAAFAIGQAKFGPLASVEGDSLDARLGREIGNGLSAVSNGASAYRLPFNLTPADLKDVPAVIVRYCSGDQILPPPISQAQAPDAFRS